MTRQSAQDWNRLIEAYVDGELDQSDRSALEAELEQSDALRTTCAAVREMGNLLRVRNQAATDATDFSELWNHISAGLEEEVQCSVDPIQLQAFADGELSGRSAVDVADALSHSLTGRREIEALAEIGDMVRMANTEGVEAADFSTLWSKLDAELAPEFEAAGQLQRGPQASQDIQAKRLEQNISILFFDRVIAFLGGYRAVLLSAATAAAVVLVMINGTGETDGEGQDLNLRMVHIDEVRSEPGFAVTVDHSDNAAPVIYIRPQAGDDRSNSEFQDRGVYPRERTEDRDERFDDPI